MVKQPEDQFDEQGTTYHLTHFMMETVNLAPFVVFWENMIFSAHQKH